MEALRARSIVVTGANRGIGLELVRQLLEVPNPPQWLFACSRSPDGERGQELRKLASSHPNLVMVTLDTTNLASITEAAAFVGDHLKDTGLNMLINNAGILKGVTLDTVSKEDMEDVYKTNVTGSLLVSKAFLPLLKKAAQGSSQKGLSCSKAAIINISSILGCMEFVPQTYSQPVIAYRCSKAALNMLTKCQSLTYKEDGILCTAIHPGWVKTDMGTQAATMTVDESVQRILQVLPNLIDEHSGSLVDWKGKKLPW